MIGDLVDETPYAEITSTLKVLAKYGVGREQFNRIRYEEDSFGKRVAEFLLRGGMEGSCSVTQAREVMGEQRFFGIEDWKKFYNVPLTDAECEQVPEFPWSEQFLQAPCPFLRDKRIKDTHFAFIGLPRMKGCSLTLNKLIIFNPSITHPRLQFANDLWKRQHPFATEKTCRFRWYLMPLISIASEAMTFKEQTLFTIPADYEVAHAVEEATKDILFYHKTGRYPSRETCSRCNDIPQDEYHVIVGISKTGLVIDEDRDGDRDRLGPSLALSVKLPSAN